MNHITNLLRANPDRFRSLIILLGYIQLCKITDTEGMDDLINSVGLKANHWLPLLNELMEDEDLFQCLDGELFNALMALQMWHSDHEPEIIEGSVLWFLKKNGRI